MVHRTTIGVLVILSVVGGVQPHAAGAPKESAALVLDGANLDEQAITQAAEQQDSPSPADAYAVGIDDILDIAVLQPQALATTVTVGPDGSISFPFIGNVHVKGMSPSQIQDEIQARLADGYMRYPVVSVSLKESRSRKFLVYGEVIRPGPYVLDDSASALKAISMAGGFTKYGSSSRVKVLRPREGKPGYDTLQVNIKAVMDGHTDKDVALKPGDIVVVSEGIF
jgi:polysaccharide export outer membrane protein